MTKKYRNRSPTGATGATRRTDHVVGRAGATPVGGYPQNEFEFEFEWNVKRLRVPAEQFAAGLAKRLRDF